LFLFSVGLFGWDLFIKDPYITDEPIEIQDASYYHGNNLQLNASVLMTSWDGQLYFYISDSGTINRSDYDRQLCLFHDGTISIVRRFDKQILAMKDGRIYLRTSTSEGGDHMLYCYNIAEDTETELVSFSWAGSFNHRDNVARIMADGVLYLRVCSDTQDYFPIEDSHVGEPETWQESYLFGEYRYVVAEDAYGARSIVRMTAGESSSYVYDLPPGRLNVFFCEGGLLLHNEMFGNLLYYIEGNTGKLVTLFTIECARSVSAVNVHGTYAYLSFVRYEKDDTVFAKTYDDDTLTGTYRIDLVDYSAEKISNNVYNGLYIFDDSGIYACDVNNDIYKIDFDGDVIMKMFVH
jgi:hypothetical protein